MVFWAFLRSLYSIYTLAQNFALLIGFHFSKFKVFWVIFRGQSYQLLYPGCKHRCAQWMMFKVAYFAIMLIEYWLAYIEYE